MEVQRDALVIGGGPAGSTAATVLAQYGHRVLLIEKERFPRYHIGESLMPFCYFTFERIGVLEKIQKSAFPRKYSVQFASLNGKVSQPFYFFQHFDHPASVTWQVVRSEFDLMLLNNAREKGVEVWEETRARDLIRDERGFVVGVRAENAAGKQLELRAPITIDCSGRDALTLSRNRWRNFDQYLKKIALWTYYRGARRDPGLDEGATTIVFLPEKGWFWYIPLPDDVVSVGIVADRDYLYSDTRDIPAIFAREIKKNPWIEDHLSTGHQFGEYWATGEFSYRGEHCADNGLLLAGDAFAFLDPVFSSGVFLALKSGELAGDAAHRALEAGDFSAEMFRDYGETMCYGIETMRKVVYAFYDKEFTFRDMFAKYPHIHGKLTDCLTGNLFQDFDELFRVMSEFTRLPEPLPYGRARVSDSKSGSELVPV